MTAQPLTDRGRRTREGLILAARNVFEVRGYDGTRMGDIAAAAGVSHGTVYTWFATKDAVLAAVADSIIADLYASMRTPEGTDAAARIDRANRIYLDSYRQNAGLLGVIEQAAATREEFRAVLAELRATHVRRVAATIERMQKDGDARGDLDPQVSAAALCSMVEGFSRHWFGRGETYDEEVAVRTLTQLWTAALGMTKERG
jgi:AcrR family transcriptional regulator